MSPCLLKDSGGQASPLCVCDPTGPQETDRKRQGALLWSLHRGLARLLPPQPLHILKGKDISLVVAVTTRNTGLLGSLFFPGTEYWDYTHRHH